MFSESIKAQLVRGALGSGMLSMVHKSLGLILSIILARTLGAESYGYYAFAVSLIGLLAVPGQLGLPQFLTREIAILQSCDHWQAMTSVRKRALHLAFWGIGGSVLAAVVILQVAKGAPAVDPTTIVLAIALLPLQVLSELVSGLLRGLRKVIHSMWPGAALKPAVLLTFVLTIALLEPNSLSAANVMTVNVAVSGLTLVVLVMIVMQSWPAGCRASAGSGAAEIDLGSLMAFGLLGASNIIVQKTDVVMLGFFSSAGDVGIYHVLVQGAMIVSFGFAAVNSVLSPNIARFASDGDKVRMQRLMSLSSLAVFSAALLILSVLCFIGDDILGVVFGEEFRRGYVPLLILGFGQLVNASVGSVGTFLSMTGHERATLNAILIAAVVNVVLNAALIPAFGMTGAAVATMVSTVLWNVIMSVDVYRRLGIVPGPFRFPMSATGEN